MAERTPALDDANGRDAERSPRNILEFPGPDRESPPTIHRVVVEGRPYELRIQLVPAPGMLSYEIRTALIPLYRVRDLDHGRCIEAIKQLKQQVHELKSAMPKPVMQG
jgi:hypothetical protein